VKQVPNKEGRYASQHGFCEYRGTPYGTVPGGDEVKQVPNHEGRYTSQHGFCE
jgi:hypothetical protein